MPLGSTGKAVKTCLAPGLLRSDYDERFVESPN